MIVFRGVQVKMSIKYVNIHLSNPLILFNLLQD